ncbi:MAG: hypothetical protein WC829_02020 [Hyphomicrobium sp.]|jgi:hypothetical protein
MDQTVLLWIATQGIAIGIAGVSALVMTHRNLTAKIEAGDAEIHSRVNETREKYVRRDDMDGHLNLLRNQMDRMDGKLDRLLERPRPNDV